MINRAELKQLAKSQLNGKWGSGVLITFVYGIVCFGIGTFGMIPVIGNVIPLILTGPIVVGLAIAYIKFIQGGSQLEVGDLFQGFNDFGRTVGMYLWYVLWFLLWFFLFVIPGIVKAISYSQCFFIIADNPNVKVKDALKISMKMTQGYKWEIFVLGLSFLGWVLLGILSLFIGFLWLSPYMYTTFTNLYFKLKQESIIKGICTEAEFNGGVAAVPPVNPTPPAESTPSI
jgi:uncharacterized membrane protein